MSERSGGMRNIESVSTEGLQPTAQREREMRAAADVIAGRISDLLVLVSIVAESYLDSNLAQEGIGPALRAIYAAFERARMELRSSETILVLEFSAFETDFERTQSFARMVSEVRGDNHSTYGARSIGIDTLIARLRELREDANGLVEHARKKLECRNSPKPARR